MFHRNTITSGFNASENRSSNKKQQTQSKYPKTRTVRKFSSSNKNNFELKSFSSGYLDSKHNSVIHHTLTSCHSPNHTSEIPEAEIRVTPHHCPVSKTLESQRGDEPRFSTDNNFMSKMISKI